MSYDVLAEEIARRAHAGQKDRQGRPYIEHPERVAARMDTEEERAVAWLHDVIEDTHLTAQHLLDEGIPAHVVRSVVTMTRLRGQSDDEYYAGFLGDEVALKVKTKGDFMDNLDPRRLLTLPITDVVHFLTKYAHGLDVLTGELPR